MHVLKYNNHQISIFDFEKSRESRHAFQTKLRTMLGLEDEGKPTKMLEACFANPSVFSLGQRHFLYDIAVLHYDGKQLTEGQIRYLASLYRTSLK